MNHLKEHVKTEKIEYFLTYADNYATGYFRKQGFSKNLSMATDRWAGWIKDYDGGTLMECKINQHINYLDIPGTLAAQREAVYARIKQITNTHSVYPGLDFSNGRKYAIEEVSNDFHIFLTSPPFFLYLLLPQLLMRCTYLILLFYFNFSFLLSRYQGYLKLVGLSLIHLHP